MKQRVTVVSMVAGLLLVLAAVNYTIFQREQLLAQGQRIYLPLAPIDPRSLMQGDYMALRFQLAIDVDKAMASALKDGVAVVKVDNNGVAAFVRIDDGQALQVNEQRVAFKTRKRQVQIVTNAYFFQEGSRARFEPARFGVLRVNPQGKALLTALADGKRVQL
jgi:uncharacterized membrane-anchored protein